jgi:hypothetical protein
MSRCRQSSWLKKSLWSLPVLLALQPAVAVGGLVGTMPRTDAAVPAAAPASGRACPTAFQANRDNSGTTAPSAETGDSQKAIMTRVTDAPALDWTMAGL